MFLISILSLASIVFNINTLRTQITREVPYIYYYSFEESAFVIEKIDGTNQSILSYYPFPAETAVLADGTGYLSGPGWSATGDWFAWTHRLRNGSPSRDAYLVNYLTRLTQAIDRDFIVVNLEWHPIDNLLLLLLRTDYGFQDVGNELLGLYDADKNEYVFTLNLDDLLAQGDYVKNLIWNVTGDSILIDGHSSVSVISLEGAIIFSTGSKSPICLSSGVPQWFTASHFAYLPDEDNHLAVRDVSTQSTVFNIALPDGEVTGVSWSPNHEYALVWIESSQDSFIGSLWLVSLNASTVVMIDDGVPLNCVDVSSRWLNNDIFTFLNATASLSIYSALDSELYSGSEITDLPLTTNITFEHDEEIVYFGSFASEPYGGDALFQYNIRSRDLDEVTTLCDERPIYFDYVSAIDHDRIIFADRLVDFSSQTCRKLPASNIGLPFTAEDVVWQAETHWVLALSEAFEGLYPVYGMDTDEGASRFLTRCEIDSRACYGWLPDLFPELTP